MKRPGLWLLLMGVGLGLIVAAIGRRATTDGADVAIRINEATIGADEVRALRQAMRNERGGSDAVAERAIVDALIDQELLIQYGRQQGLAARDPVIRRRIVQLVLEQLEAAVPEPSEAELVDYYAAHVSRYAAPAQVRFWQLYLPLGRGDDVSSAQEAARLRREIQREADMQTLMAAWPHQLRGHDGEVWMPEPRVQSMFGPQFAALLFDSPTGQAVGPLISSLGAHVVWIRELRPAQERALDEVRPAVVRDWRAAQRAERTQALLADLRAAASIEIAEGLFGAAVSTP